ncbi:hypothetical protein ElyMa_006459800 [Elysia marginata]|uniref:Reverse transcriptase domain-containing protein n=1 Tax=Elysia marginata TaxID=1093978 RepID=A0AAV4I1N0_9GAST|nr:hypothetical protein ElyMa_006459800 [Elysia marginata]
MQKELLIIFKEIVEGDELRNIILFLLNETTLDVKVNVCTQETPFTSNIGTPQEDSLSPILHNLFGKCSKKISGVRRTTISSQLIYAL